MDKKTGRMTRFFPAFWTLLLCLGLLLDSLSLASSNPERVAGWRVVGLVGLIVILLSAYAWFGWSRLYGDRHVSDNRALLALGVQVLALLLLVWQYDQTFIWLSLSIAYEVVGGLARRLWLPPLAGILLVIVVAVVPRDGSLSPQAVVALLFLAISNVGIAVFILALRNQRDQLRIASERLMQAHIALAANAVQAEELAVLRERARIARAMHDDVGHALVSINVKLEAAQLLYARDAERGAAELEATRALVRDTMAQLRHTLTDLRAPITDHDDLPAALTRLANETQQRTGITVTTSIPAALAALPTDLNEALWYVAREALTNVERHTAADSASVIVEQQDDGWRLRLLDDGPGINPSDLSRAGHYGVLGMRERIQAVGGTFNIQRGKSGGTVVEAFLPRPALQKGS